MSCNLSSIFVVTIVGVCCMNNNRCYVIDSLCWISDRLPSTVFMSPSTESPREHARALVHVKDAIEAEITLQLSILRANNCDMTTPLVDSEGFPRADLDIYAIRSARARIVELRNDLKHTMDEIEKALQKVYDPSLVLPSPSSPGPANAPSTPSTHTEESLSPFAKVDGVAPGSPAAHAVCPVPTVLCSQVVILDA